MPEPEPQENQQEPPKDLSHMYFFVPRDLKNIPGVLKLWGYSIDDCQSEAGTLYIREPNTKKSTIGTLKLSEKDKYELTIIYGIRSDYVDELQIRGATSLRKTADVLHLQYTENPPRKEVVCILQEEIRRRKSLAELVDGKQTLKP